MPLKLIKLFFFLGLFVKEERVLLLEDFPGDYNSFDCCYGIMVTINYQQVDLFLPSPFYLSHQKEDCNFFLLPSPFLLKEHNVLKLTVNMPGNIVKLKLF